MAATAIRVVALPFAVVGLIGDFLLELANFDEPY